MFEVFVLNEIVVGYESEMNISGADLTRFLYCFDLDRHTLKKRFNGLLWLIGNCGNLKDLMNNLNEFSTVISIIENIPALPDGKRKFVMDKKYTIAVAGTGDGDIIGTTKKNHVTLRFLAA